MEKNNLLLILDSLVGLSFFQVSPPAMDHISHTANSNSINRSAERHFPVEVQLSHRLAL